MKRILITNGIQLTAEEYRDNLFKDRKGRFIKPLDGLNRLKSTITLGQNYVDYVDAIIRNYDEILTLHPKDFEAYKQSYFNMLSDEQLSKKFNNSCFYEAIVDAMRYKEVRETEITKYIEKLGIRTCVYCNAQYAKTIHYTNQLKAGYEIDHYKPKSQYPFLCISFFNLQPSCASCNRWKSDEESKFNLYTDDDDVEKLNPFLFSLNESSIIKYMLVQSSDVLNIMIGSQEPGLASNHNKRFHVNALYQSFKDEAEELLWKYKTRNDTYINQLIDSFQKKFPYKRNEIKRFLYGFYDQEKDIHKRPLTKMKQDIAKQFEDIMPNKNVEQPFL